MRYAERVRRAISDDVAAHGDIVRERHRLTIATEERRELDTLKAWPVLEQAGFGDAELAECVEISVSRAERVAAKKAGRGHGAGAVRELNEKLTAADAVHTREIKKLAQRRA